MSHATPLFDDSLLYLVKALRTLFDDVALQQGVILRDASGRLSFVAPFVSPREDEKLRQSRVISDALNAYARVDNVISYRDDPGTGQLLISCKALPVQCDGSFYRLIDNRIVGSGWLEVPVDELRVPPRIVFASLKGGVGRSTALAVAAADLARRNRNVLVVDLDLEAPGLGAMLLDEDRLPKLGVVDFLVENGLGGVRRELLDDFIGLSGLTLAEGGRVDVMPAFGRRSVENPENVLPKLARALIEDIGPDGDVVSVTSQISTMMGCIAGRASYDVILIDSKAGLAELAAPAVLGLGATILLFGSGQRQTLQSYRSLFAGLRLLAQRDRAAGRTAEWRLMLKPVYSKASLDNKSVIRYREDLYDLFAENIYDAEESSEPTNQDINFDIDDPEAPHWPLIIPFSQAFVDFDPVLQPEHLTQPFYEQTFRTFLNGVDSICSSVSARGESALREMHE